MGKINLHNYEAFLIDYLDGNLNETSIIELKAFVLANPQLEIDLDDFNLPAITNDDIENDFKNELKRSEFFVEDEELINYLENNLTEAERKVFELNLLNNKDLAFKLQAYKKTVLNSDASIAFADKTGLYKTADELILNNIVLAYAEDQLSVSDKLNFEKELKISPSLQKELASFQKTKLLANNTIVFEDKEGLKKDTKVIALFSFRAVASMAAAILLLIGLAFVFNYYTLQPAEKINEMAKNNINKVINSAEDQNNKAIDSTDTLGALVKESKKMIANNNSKSKNSSIKKDNELSKQETNPVVVNKKEEKEKEPVVNEEPNDGSKTVIANNQSIEDTNHVTLANSSLNQSNYSKQTSLIAVEENDNDDEAPVAPAKKGFWQRAVKVAKQFNKLGVKAIDGEESQGKNYALSFNSFSVEKR